MKISSMIFAVALSVSGSTLGIAAPPSPAYQYVNGRWWDGTQFLSKTMWSDHEALLRASSPGRVDEVIDMQGGFVIPPLAEGHNHWLEAAAIDQYNACYLADGVYYVKDMGNLPWVMDQIRDRVNLPTSVDLVSAMTPFTGPGAHPIEIIDQLVSLGIFPKDWKPDYDGKAQYVVRTEADVDRRFAQLLKQNPAYVKVFLLFSEEYQARLNDPSKYGNHRGMDPTLLPHLVKLAHAQGLRVEVHIYTAQDFRTAILAGADEIAHLPGNGANAEPEMDFARFRLTPADAKLAASHHVTVTTTLDWLADKKTDWTARLVKEVIVPNLKLLKQYGVPILVGSDHFRRSSLGEVLELRDLGVFTNIELLKMATLQTTRSIFPTRKLGRLEDRYEADFLVLKGDPTENLDNLKSIQLRVKQGRRLLALPATSLKRPGLDCL